MRCWSINNVIQPWWLQEAQLTSASWLACDIDTTALCVLEGKGQGGESSFSLLLRDVAFEAALVLQMLYGQRPSRGILHASQCEEEGEGQDSDEVYGSQSEFEQIIWQVGKLRLKGMEPPIILGNNSYLCSGLYLTSLGTSERCIL